MTTETSTACPKNAGGHIIVNNGKTHSCRYCGEVLLTLPKGKAKGTGLTITRSAPAKGKKR